MRQACVRFTVLVLVLMVAPGFIVAAQEDFTASYELLLDGTDFYPDDHDLSIGTAAMSADGSTILAYTYYYYGDERNLFVINTTTGARADVALDATASWGVIGASMAISENGSVAFVYSTTWLYTGTLWPVAGLDPGPTVHSISFDPPEMPDNNPDATVVLMAAITDPDGLANVAGTSLDHLLNGTREEYFSELPVYFTWNPEDDGQPPDAIPGDGIYSSLGETGGRYPTITNGTIRVSAQDDDGHVFVRDVVLFVCPSAGCSIFSDGFEDGTTGAWQ